MRKILILALLFASASWAGAQTLVQVKSTFTNASSPVTLAYTTNNTAGNLLIACVGVDAGATISTPTDTRNTWVLAKTQNGSGGSGDAACYYVANCGAGANTVSAAWTGGGTAGHLDIYEVSGMLTVSPLDQTGSVASSATASVSTAGATSQANEFVVAFFYDSPNNRTLTVGAGYSNFQLTNNTSGGDCSGGESKIVSTTGTQTATIGGNSTDVLVQIIVTFKATTTATLNAIPMVE